MYRACIFKDLNFVVFIFEGIDAESKKREESSSLVKLELGIAGCGHVNPVRQKQEKAESSFTAEQLRELYYQTLVFNFIAYGLPVPFHFLLPIWKSIFQSDPSCECSILNFLWDDMGIMCSELILFLWNFFFVGFMNSFFGFSGSSFPPSMIAYMQFYRGTPRMMVPRLYVY